MPEQPRDPSSSETPSPKPCENCCRSLGRLEKPMIWHGHLVCAPCFALLSGPMPPLPAVLLPEQKLFYKLWNFIGICIVVSMVVSVLFMIVLAIMSMAVAAEHASDASKAATSEVGTLCLIFALITAALIAVMAYLNQKSKVKG